MKLKVPYGYVHLTGDNKEVSKDSNDYGAIPYGLIQSKVLLRVSLVYFCFFWS